MKFRWLEIHNEVTLSDVREYADRNDVGMYAARKALVNAVKELQYLENGAWVTVPTEILIREK